MKLKIFFLGLFIITSVACSSTGYMPTPPAYSVITTSHVMTVHYPLTIKPNLARVHFQGSEVRNEKQIDKYYPNCSLEIKTLSSSPQTIEPDKFEIYRIQHDEEGNGMAVFVPPIPFAQEDSYAPSHENWITQFYLRSGKQPDVLRLNCQHWEDPADARHLTYEEIRKTLGKYITFSRQQ